LTRRALLSLGFVLPCLNDTKHTYIVYAGGSSIVGDVAEDPGAYIRFSGGSGTLKVRETPAEIEQAVLEIGPMDTPFVHLTRPSGKPVVVNAAMIQTISEPGPYE
jgi:hypothetical protein